MNKWRFNLMSLAMMLVWAHIQLWIWLHWGWEAVACSAAGSGLAALVAQVRESLRSIAFSQSLFGRHGE